MTTAVQDKDEKVRMAVVKSLIRLGTEASLEPLSVAFGKPGRALVHFGMKLAQRGEPPVGLSLGVANGRIFHDCSSHTHTPRIQLRAANDASRTRNNDCSLSRRRDGRAC